MISRRVAALLLGCTLSSAAWADSLSVPGMTGPLQANPNPTSLDAGELGTIYIDGAVSGLGMWQQHRSPGDDSSRLDLDNGQVFIQKTDGLVQFYLQAGGYTLPSLGTSYRDMPQSTGDLFGPVPVAYVKLAPNEHFSVQAGKLYTLIGTENTFTFQNFNIERGLLWNQTNAVNRGVQLNYNDGPISSSVALSDGFYSDSLDWASGLLTYTRDAENSVSLIASGNIKHSDLSTYATPLAQDNSQIYDLFYTYNAGPWTISPTLQYTHVPQDAGIGLADSASSYGLALAGKYSFDTEWSLAARAEYIDTSGGTNLAYGPGSNAWSFTLTPTWQQDIYFVRGEAAYVQASDITAGDAFGSSGNEKTQGRVLVETGLLF